MSVDIVETTKLIDQFQQEFEADIRLPPDSIRLMEEVIFEQAMCKFDIDLRKLEDVVADAAKRHAKLFACM